MKCETAEGGETLNLIMCWTVKNGRPEGENISRFDRYFLLLFYCKRFVIVNISGSIYELLCAPAYKLY